MKTSLMFLRSGALCAALALASGSAMADGLKVYKAQPGGSAVKIDGDSNIHKWVVEGKIIGGQLEIDPAFALAGTPAPGKVNAHAKATIPIRSLKSGKARMDEVMQEHMKAADFPRIEFELLDMTLKEAPKSVSDPLVFSTNGKLTISGVSRTNAMDFVCDRADASKLKFKGVTQLKMTDFGIKPPSPAIALGLITTKDEVKVSIEWSTAVPAADGAAK